MHLTPEAPTGTSAAPAMADTALVSVIVRSVQRDSLAQTLASVAAQTHPRIEVLLVNARGGEHPPVGERCGALGLRVVNDGGRALPRAEAANAGLEAARGAWLMFVDDDDTIDPGHVERLHAALVADPQRRVAYTGCRIVDADGRLLRVLDEPFDAVRLWQANYLPIHAVMFSRSAVDTGLRFDPALPVYEDWDFWRQLSLRHPFLHLPGVSASYRWVGDSGLSADRDEALAAAARAQFFRKWLPRLTAQGFEQLATAAERLQGRSAGQQQHIVQLEAEVAARGAALDAAARDAEDLRRAHAAQAAALDAERAQRQALEQNIEQLRTALDDVSRHGADLHRQLNEARADYRDLEAAHRATLATLSWRVTAPLRGVRRACSRAGVHAAARALIRRLPARLKDPLRERLRHSAAGARLLQRLAPVSPLGAPPAEPAPLDKEAERRHAEAELTAFLAGGRRVVIDAAAADPARADATVIVVVYNQAGLTLACLQALAASRGVTLQTLIVDNASSDRMPQLLQRIDGATLLPQRENLGFLRAVNLAARQARGRHLLLLNNDALVEPQTIARLVRRLDADPAVGAVGGMIVLWDGRLQEAGSIVWRDGSCLGYGRGDSPDAPPYRFVRDVDYCSGALLMVRRSLFDALGGFDDRYAPAYYEESDFCARLWQAGHRVVYDPSARVRHFEFASDAGSGRAMELQQRNRQRFAERHAAWLATKLPPSAEALQRARQILPPQAQRVLMIDDRVPLPWLGQGFPRALSLLQTLVEQGHFVSHLPLQFPHDGEHEAATTLPETVELLFGVGRARLAELLADRDGAYELLIVSRPHNMQTLDAELRRLRRRRPQAWRGTRLVYDAEALFSLREIEQAALAGHPLDAGEQQRRIAQETALARDADAVVTVSEAEAAHYRAAGFERVQVLGHTMQPAPGTAPFESRHGFVFVGALTADDTPNADSVRWFVTEVWPRIGAALGASVSLTVAGLCEAPSVLALASDSVHIAGRVDDLGALFGAARVFVVPTRFAAGIPHKAHEAAAHGLPMVASPLVARQLGWQDWLPVGSDAAGFAAACLRLHGDAAHWRTVRERQLAAVAHDCSPQRFADAVRALTAPGGSAA